MKQKEKKNKVKTDSAAVDEASDFDSDVSPNLIKEMNENDPEKMLCTPEEFQKLILDNMGFPYKIVQKEFGNYPSGMKDDLNSAAMSGMIYAAKKYDPKRASECKFISYAVHWIRFFVHEEIRSFYPIKFNQNFVSKRNKIKKYITKYSDEHNGTIPSIEDISKNVGMSEKVVKNVLNVNGGENFTFISFNSPSLVDDGNGDMKEVRQDALVNEYLNTASCQHSVELDLDLERLIADMKTRLSGTEFRIFNDYYFNNKSFTELSRDYNLRFPSKAAYIIKKCEKLARELYYKDLDKLDNISQN